MMLTEISLNVLDIAENSVRAGANKIQIEIHINDKEDKLYVRIEDNGCGMNAEQARLAQDPFFTSRTTRRVGLGLPFFEQEALMTGGSFRLSSTEKKGTVVSASFVMSHIDRMPLGDINGTIYNLIAFHENVRFLYTYRYNQRQFVMDTKEFRDILGNMSFLEPEISAYIKAYLEENKREIDGGVTI